MTNKEIMYKEFAEHFSEENTKLKAEIDELSKANGNLVRQNAKLCEEIAKLKGEQSK